MIRELTPLDFPQLVQCLSELSPIRIDEPECLRLFIARENVGIKTFVKDMDGEIVGTASMSLEQKFIHDGGIVGRIEDVAVRRQWWKFGIGSELVQYCINVARDEGCYKVLLDCSNELLPFYKRFGFTRSTNGMRIDF